MYTSSQSDWVKKLNFELITIAFLIEQYDRVS